MGESRPKETQQPMWDPPHPTAALVLVAGTSRDPLSPWEDLLSKHP